MDLIDNIQKIIMKLILFFALVLPITHLSSQSYSRFTTSELLNITKADNLNFKGSFAADQFNYALPLIDSMVAVELAKLFGLHIEDNYVYAIGLQCRDDSLKQLILDNLIDHDKLCTSTLISKNNYDQQGAAAIYEYGRLSKVLLEQTDTKDTNLLKIAGKEFEYWAPMAQDYIDIIMKNGIHQLAIKSGKTKFAPCVLASAGNCSLWIACIYLITGKEEYGSANEQLNEVYRKLMKRLRIDKKTDNRKDFIRFKKEDIITSAIPLKTLDSLDFETIPELKEKLENVRKKNGWQINIYTHLNKALLYFGYTEIDKTGFSRNKTFDLSSMYLAELNTPTTIKLTKIGFREF